MTIERFDTREKIEEFIVSSCPEDSQCILIRGSTAFGDVNEFSDFDVEVFGPSPFKPRYHFAFYEDNLILITLFYMGNKPGENIQPPFSIKVLKGEYTTGMKDIQYSEGTPDGYTRAEWVVRKRQVIVDELFKYLRHKDEKILENIQKKIQF